MQIGNDYANKNYIIDRPLPSGNVQNTSPSPSSGLGEGFVAIFPKGFGQEDLFGKIKDAYGEEALKKMGNVECATCASRTYQDGSNDPGVSFKTPTHISPSQSGAAVMSHEQEHVSREQVKAKQEGGEVISQSVSIFTSTCPECGRGYTSGGLTKTTVRYSQNEDDDQLKGKLVDMKL